MFRGRNEPAQNKLENDYYPFGMLQPDRGFNAWDYRFGFNGKEKNNEVAGLGNQIDYGMRIYDPRIGHFLSIDPLTKCYPEFTPFQFAGSNPILNIDIDGKEGENYWVQLFRSWLG